MCDDGKCTSTADVLKKVLLNLDPAVPKRLIDEIIAGDDLIIASRNGDKASIGVISPVGQIVVILALKTLVATIEELHDVNARDAASKKGK